MKFLADMGISLKTISWLRNEGYDSKHLREDGLQKLEDDKILKKARKERRILLTMDLDFGYLLAISGGKLPSVIIFRLSDESSEVINEKLRDIIMRCNEELGAGAIISVSDKTYRVRLLPIRGKI